jgi:naringenin degradation protein FdeH
MSEAVRRVVTGHDDEGKAVVIFDGETPNVVRPENRPGVAINNLWWVTEAPARLAGNAETTDREIGLLPPPRGSVFRVIEFPPEAGWIDKIDRAAAKASFAGLGAAGVADASETPPHPLMHRTETIDYAIILSGEIHMVLDHSEVALKAGDTVVQRGTNHAWSNRSDRPCRIAFILIDGVFD